MRSEPYGTNLMEQWTKREDVAQTENAGVVKAYGKKIGLTNLVCTQKRR